jgi:hypothetical protein
LVFEKNANFFAENCRKSPKIVENRRKLSKIGENCRKSAKIVENRRKLSKIGENCDHNIDPWLLFRKHFYITVVITPTIAGLAFEGMKI